MTPRVVLDTNVIVSGFLLPESIPGKLLRLAAERRMTLVLSNDILVETERILRKKIRYTPEDARQAVATLELMGEKVSPATLVEIVTADPPDNRILECAWEGEADVIVSGDKKHLLRLGTFRHLPILSPANFLRTYFPHPGFSG